MKRIQLTLTAQSIPDHFSADISVVIDVLRASSVITTALACGTPYIIPASSIEEAQKLSERYPDALLAGERQAVRIPGFDLGNSPIEHRQQRSGKPIILTTTNGTLTLSRVLHSGKILIGSFLNINAVLDYLKSLKGDLIHLACAGTNGAFSLDDFLMAGGLVADLQKEGYQADDAGLAAGLLYENNRKTISEILQNCHHYQILKSKGFDEDLAFCLSENQFENIGVVEHKHPADMIIRNHQ